MNIKQKIFGTSFQNIHLVKIFEPCKHLAQISFNLNSKINPITLQLLIQQSNKIALIDKEKLDF